MQYNFADSEVYTYIHYFSYQRIFQFLILKNGPRTLLFLHYTSYAHQDFAVTFHLPSNAMQSLRKLYPNLLTFALNFGKILRMPAEDKKRLRTSLFLERFIFIQNHYQ